MTTNCKNCGLEIAQDDPLGDGSQAWYGTNDLGRRGKFCFPPKSGDYSTHEPDVCTPTECQHAGCRETDTHKVTVTEDGGYKLFCLDHALWNAWGRGYRAGRSDTLDGMAVIR